MIDIKNIENINWENKKVTIIGYGESGIAAANLCDKIGCKIFISDSGNKKMGNLKYDSEFGNHSNKVFNSDLIIVSPGVPTKHGIVKDCLDRGLLIVSEIEFASWFTNSPIIAITGSNGKTTTTSLVSNILTKTDHNVLTGGNIGTPFSENILIEMNTAANNNVHLLEVSSFQMEFIHTFKPILSCILNISEDHMDRYKTMDEYLEAKLNISKNLVEPAWLVYNADDAVLSTSLKNRHRTKLFTLTSNMQAHYQINDNEICNLQSNNTLISFDEIKLLGEHNLQNILAASTIANLFDVCDDDISFGISNFMPLPHRLELVKEQNGIKYINDSKATNINSVEVAIESFNNIILILGGSLKGDVKFSQLIPKINERVNRVICYGESRNYISKQLKNIKCKIDLIENFETAILNSINSIEYHESVLLSPGCASFDQFVSYSDRGNKFKKIINNYNVETN